VTGQLWTCPYCRAEQTHDAWCEACSIGRYPTWEIQFAHHVLEHLQDGLTEPLSILEAMQDRPCYRTRQLDLGGIARHIRLLTKDTSQIARDLLKARAANMALRASADGASEATLVALLKGIQVLGDVVEHKGEMITKHIVELHEGPPPKRER
jgi:hypothetical protein